jgi:hypothetical protein
MSMVWRGACGPILPCEVDREVLYDDPADIS